MNWPRPAYTGPSPVAMSSCHTIIVRDAWPPCTPSRSVSGTSTTAEQSAKPSTGRYYEVRYEQLVNDTEWTLRELLDFLGEPWDPVVLEYDKQLHDL